MTLVARIQGQVENAEQLISILTTVKADNEASLRAAQIERFACLPYLYKCTRIMCSMNKDKVQFVRSTHIHSFIRLNQKRAAE